MRFHGEIFKNLLKATGTDRNALVSRLVAISSNTGRGGIESANSSQMSFGGIGSILLLVAGLLGIYGAVKNDGRVPALLAVGAFALFALTFLGVFR